MSNNVSDRVKRYLAKPDSTVDVRIMPAMPASVSSLIGKVFVLAASLLINGAFLMLGFMGAHQVWVQVPPVGFWTSFLLALGVAALKPSGRRVLSS